LIDDRTTAYALWPYIHGLFEFSANLSLLVTIYFWCVELPCMGERGDYDEMKFANWFALVFDHTLPVIIMAMEWVHNGIRVEWDRFPYYVAGGYLYIIVLLIATFVVHKSDNNTTYASMLFYGSPWVANSLVVGVFVLQGLTYWLLVWATDLKLTTWRDLSYPETKPDNKKPRPKKKPGKFDLIK